MKTKHIIASIATLGTLAVGVTTPILPGSMTISQINQIADVVNYEAKVHGGTFIIQNPVFIDGNLDIIDVMNKIDQFPVNTETVTIPNEGLMSKTDYQALKDSLNKKISSKQSLVNKIIGN